jgi:c-di-GMP-binding flagellar brake protein YcgR
VSKQAEATDEELLPSRLVSSSRRQSPGGASSNPGTYPYERRRHPRTAACYKVRIVTDYAKIIDGNTVNVSDGGALIKLEEWCDFSANDLIGISIAKHDEESQEKSSETITTLGLIRRTEEESRRIAVMFVKDTAG